MGGGAEKSFYRGQKIIDIAGLYKKLVGTGRQDILPVGGLDHR